MIHPNRCNDGASLLVPLYYISQWCFFQNNIHHHPLPNPYLLPLSLSHCHFQTCYLLFLPTSFTIPLSLSDVLFTILTYLFHYPIVTFRRVIHYSYLPLSLSHCHFQTCYSLFLPTSFTIPLSLSDVLFTILTYLFHYPIVTFRRVIHYSYIPLSLSHCHFQTCYSLFLPTSFTIPLSLSDVLFTILTYLFHYPIVIFRRFIDYSYLPLSLSHCPNHYQTCYLLQ